jgi:hypothetical protein
MTRWRLPTCERLDTLRVLGGAKSAAPGWTSPASESRRSTLRRGEAITFTILALVDMAKEVKLVDGTSRLILLGANRP